MPRKSLPTNDLSFMLQRLFLSLVFIALVAPAHAQIIRGYGVKAGLTYSNVRSPDLDFGGSGTSISFDTERRPGVAIFGFVEWLDMPFFSIVTEAGYVQRGFQYVEEMRTGPGSGGYIEEQTFDTRFDYLSMAALARLRWPSGALTPYVLGGPRLDFFLGGDPDEEGTLASSYASTSLGSTFGVGAEVSRGLPVALFAEARYSVDFTNALPDVPRDAYNNAFDVVIGVRL